MDDKLFNLYFQMQKNTSAILSRNKNEELNLNYSKIYDLSLIDGIENITLEEKNYLFAMVKKIILCTDEFMFDLIYRQLKIYSILSVIIFIFFIIIYSPIYKYFFVTENDSYQELTYWEKLAFFFLYGYLEKTIRNKGYNSIKKRVF